MDDSNPPDFAWGNVENGTMSGHFREMIDRKIDMAISGIIYSYKRVLVRF